jgi:hypothetical protein
MKVLKILSVVSVILFSANTFAQSGTGYARFNDDVRIYFGAFHPTSSSEVQINGDVVRPPPVDIEDVLGVSDSKTVGWGGMRWHISRRNSLELEYFTLRRDGLVNLFPDPVEIGDLIIESGSTNTSFDITVARLTYGFSIKRSDRMDFQIKGGLHIADLAAGILLSGAVCDVSMGEMPPGCPTGQAPKQETGEVTAPLPHFGVSWAYAITPTIAVDVRAIGFAIEIDNVKGGLIELSGDLAWQPWRHFGFGLGLRYFNANVKAGDADLDGEFDLEYFGPALVVFGSF